MSNPALKLLSASREVEDVMKNYHLEKNIYNKLNEIKETLCFYSALFNEEKERIHDNVVYLLKKDNE